MIWYLPKLLIFFVITYFMVINYLLDFLKNYLIFGNYLIFFCNYLFYGNLLIFTKIPWLPEICNFFRDDVTYVMAIMWFFLVITCFTVIFSHSL